MIRRCIDLLTKNDRYSDSKICQINAGDIFNFISCTIGDYKNTIISLWTEKGEG